MVNNSQVLAGIVLLLIFCNAFDFLNGRLNLKPDFFLFFPWRIASFECIGTEVLGSLEAQKSFLSKAVVGIITLNIRISHNCRIS